MSEPQTGSAAHVQRMLIDLSQLE
uniref:Uncharacterized protein n=1 Tax=Anguilla anguilla TaxID=7936 RepID=A0A0E9S9G6_ANGAN